MSKRRGIYMIEQKCPLCGSTECLITRSAWYQNSSDLCASKIDCKHGYSFIVHDDVNYGNIEDVKRRYNIIFSILLKSSVKTVNGFEYSFKFFYEESSVGQPISEFDKINLANNMRDYPSNVIKRIESTLVNLSRKYPFVGQTIVNFPKDAPLFFCESDNLQEEIEGICSFLKELGYIEEKETGIFIISANGWKKIIDLLEKENEIHQGFIAMSFASNARSIGDVFQEAIKECGYVPQRIDQKEHNNQIVPEIFYEISRSKFLVVDVTYPNYGAYYEAGYGEALKKQVIVCCRKDVFESKDKPHFDIAQKSTIVWETEDELKQKLMKRIEATVGLNK